VVAPVIQNADKVALGEIAVQRRDLAERARGGKLRPPISQVALSPSAISACSAWTHSPQSSFLPRPRFLQWSHRRPGRPGRCRSGCSSRHSSHDDLTLSSDHRVVDGARASEFCVIWSRQSAARCNFSTMPELAISPYEASWSRSQEQDFDCSHSRRPAASQAPNPNLAAAPACSC